MKKAWEQAQNRVHESQLYTSRRLWTGVIRLVPGLETGLETCWRNAHPHAWIASPFFFSHFSFQRPTVFLVSLFLSLPSACKVSLAHEAPPSLAPCEQGIISRTLLYFFSSFYLLSCSFLCRCFFLPKKKETVTFSRFSLFPFSLSGSIIPLISSIIYLSYDSFCICLTFRRSFSFEMRDFRDPDFFLKLTVFLLLFSCFSFSLLRRKPELPMSDTNKTVSSSVHLFPFLFGWFLDCSWSARLTFVMLSSFLSSSSLYDVQGLH